MIRIVEFQPCCIADVFWHWVSQAARSRRFRRAPNRSARQRNWLRRNQTRELIAATQIRYIDHHPPFSDELFDRISTSLNRDVQRRIGDMTLGALKTFLLERSEADIHAIRTGLSSDVIVYRSRVEHTGIRCGSGGDSSGCAGDVWS